MKIVKQLILGLFITALLIIGGCVSTPTPAAVSSSGVDDLDLAVRDASDYLNDNIPRGSKIVILNVQSDSPALSEYIIDELISNAVSDRVFSVVDRQQLDAIRAEQNFQYSGEVDDNSAISIGRFLGAQTIVSGAVSRLGSGHRIRIRALEVQTAEVQGQFNRNVPSSPLIADILAGGTGATRTGSTTAAASTGSTAQAAPAQATAQVYRVGDTGPAGGIIFHDKGNNSGGWRYLEAAPEEAEFQVPWSLHQTLVEGTRQEVGSGRRNTQLIVETFARTSGEWDTAAQKCNDLEFGGYGDWFLPSSSELDRMYGNLKRRNLGGFKNDWYWSSTEVISLHGSQLVKTHNFSDGTIRDQLTRIFGTTNQRFFVRPIRQVPG